MSKSRNDIKYNVNETILLNQGEICVIKYIGKTCISDGIWYGIEYIDGTIGKHNGSINGIHYFDGNVGRCKFIRGHKIRRRLDNYMVNDIQHNNKRIRERSVSIGSNSSTGSTNNNNNNNNNNKFARKARNEISLKERKRMREEARLKEIERLKQKNKLAKENRIRDKNKHVHARTLSSTNIFETLELESYQSNGYYKRQLKTKKKKKALKKTKSVRFNRPKVVNKERYKGNKYIQKQNELREHKRSKSVKQIKQLSKKNIEENRKRHQRSVCYDDIHSELGITINDDNLITISSNPTDEENDVIPVLNVANSLQHTKSQPLQALVSPLPSSTNEAGFDDIEFNDNDNNPSKPSNKSRDSLKMNHNESIDCLSDAGSVVIKKNRLNSGFDSDVSELSDYHFMGYKSNNDNNIEINGNNSGNSGDIPNTLNINLPDKNNMKISINEQIVNDTQSLYTGTDTNTVYNDDNLFSPMSDGTSKLNFNSPIKTEMLSTPIIDPKKSMNDNNILDTKESKDDDTSGMGIIRGTTKHSKKNNNNSRKVSYEESPILGGFSWFDDNDDYKNLYIKDASKKKKPKKKKHKSKSKSKSKSRKSNHKSVKSGPITPNESSEIFTNLSELVFDNTSSIASSFSSNHQLPHRLSKVSIADSVISSLSASSFADIWSDTNNNSNKSSSIQIERTNSNKWLTTNGYPYPKRKQTISKKHRGQIWIGNIYLLRDGRKGVCRYKNFVKFAPGMWIGIEFNTNDGECDGTVNGVQYFKSKPNHFTFCQSNNIAKDFGREKKK